MTEIKLVKCVDCDSDEWISQIKTRLVAKTVSPKGDVSYKNVGPEVIYNCAKCGSVPGKASKTKSKK